MKRFFAVVGSMTLLLAGAASADPLVLDASLQCTQGNAINGVSVENVSGNAGGSDDCWGTIGDPKNDPKNDGIMIGDDLFEFVAKINTNPYDPDGDVNGIGLEISPVDINPLVGTWQFDGFDGAPFLIILKGGPDGWGAWLFDESAGSKMGSFYMWGKNGLSHFSIYKGPGGVTVPEPGTLALLGLGLIGIAAARRRKVA